MTDYQVLYEEKCMDYEIMEGEYEEFKECSKMIEGELQSAFDIATESLKDMEKKYEYLDERTSKKIERCEKEIVYLTRQLEHLQNEHATLQQSIKSNNKKLVNLEIENDNYDSQFRAKNFLIEDLEKKSDVVFEKLIILQQESEISQQKSQEENEMLKKKIEETEYELELIRKKGISIKVIDNNIANMQKKRNQNRYGKEKMSKYPFHKSGSIGGYNMQKSIEHCDERNNSDKNIKAFQTPINYWENIPIINEEVQKIKGES